MLCPLYLKQIKILQDKGGWYEACHSQRVPECEGGFNSFDSNSSKGFASSTATASGDGDHSKRLRTRQPLWLIQFLSTTTRPYFCFQSFAASDGKRFSLQRSRDGHEQTNIPQTIQSIDRCARRARFLLLDHSLARRAARLAFFCAGAYHSRPQFTRHHQTPAL